MFSVVPHSLTTVDMQATSANLLQTNVEKKKNPKKNPHKKQPQKTQNNNNNKKTRTNPS